MIRLFSTHCPKCRVLENKLKSLDKEFEIIDDNDEVVKFGTENGFNEAPLLVLEDGTILGFTDAVRYLKV